MSQIRFSKKADLVAALEARRRWAENYDKLALPSCPISAVARLDEVLAILSITKQEAFNLKGDYKDPVSGVYWVLTHDDSSKKTTVC